MSFRYVSAQEAVSDEGLRMVVVGNIPSPWGEAAKGIFHVKGIDWLAVRSDHQDRALKKWAGQHGGPVAMYRQEAPRSGWAEILLLAERLNTTPSLIPADPSMRAMAFGLSHEICGEAGLGWSRRLQGIHAGLQGKGGFPKPIAMYLAAKYGYVSESGSSSGQRVIDILNLLVQRLKAQSAAGSDYYIGDSLSMVDIYSATFAALFSPLPDTDCQMEPHTRVAFESVDALTKAALDPILLEHRDRMYRDHLALPLSL